MSARAVKQFVQDIEDNIYKNEMVYRSILVSGNLAECYLLKIEMINKDYSVFVVDDIFSVEDYNLIDERIVILTHEKFIDFIVYLDEKNGGLPKSSFNFIAFNYTINKNVVSNLVFFYVDRTNNNEQDTIIFDENYLNLLQLERTKK